MTMRRLIRVGEPALWALRHYAGSAMLLIGMTMVASAAIVSVTTLVHPGSLLHSRLEFSTAGGVASHGTWGRTPAATENAAIANLFDLLLCGMGAVVAVAVVSLASLFAAQGIATDGGGGGTTRRRSLPPASPWEHCHRGVHSRVVRTHLGFGCGSLREPPEHHELARQLRASLDLPKHRRVERTCSHIRSVCRVAVALRSQPFRDATSSPVPLALPAFQLGLSLIVLTAAGLLTRQTALRLESKPAASAAGQVFRQLVDDSRTGRPGQSVRHASRRAGRREAVRYRESDRNGRSRRPRDGSRGDHRLRPVLRRRNLFAVARRAGDSPVRQRRLLSRARRASPGGAGHQSLRSLGSDTGRGRQPESCDSAFPAGRGDRPQDSPR